MDGTGVPDLLVNGNGSPHSYSLRPSEARVLSRADIVFWIGPDFETFLQKPLDSLASEARPRERGRHGARHYANFAARR